MARDVKKTTMMMTTNKRNWKKKKREKEVEVDKKEVEVVKGCCYSLSDGDEYV